VTVIAGDFSGKSPPSPPPHSWAARADADVAIWAIDLEEGASVTLPPARRGSHRALYFYDGTSLSIGDESGTSGKVFLVEPSLDLPLAAAGGPARVLVLQGRPIGEPVVQHGPFVMNERREIHEAITDYQRTGFGGWPWASDAPVHPRESGRFAVHPDGRQQEMGR
jgi:redox-sensitive bicupin YhaK (pirin superfamily)